MEMWKCWKNAFNIALYRNIILTNGMSGDYNDKRSLEKTFEMLMSLSLTWQDVKNDTQKQAFLTRGTCFYCKLKDSM